MSNVTEEKGAAASRLAGAPLPVRAALGIARGGLRLGLGLAAIAVDGAVHAGRRAAEVGSKAMERGAGIEADASSRLLDFERDRVAYMKSYVEKARHRAKAARKSARSKAIERQVEDALATFDVPTRDDVRELNRHLANLSDQVSRMNRG